MINYRVAMRRAEQMLGQVPLGQQVVLETHRVLLSGPRGEGKSPGEYRRVANWIGRPGCDINDATFVPVDVEKLPDAMAAWEHYVQENAWDPLVQLAVLHAEFEALHPFLDGNGRLGRILAPLFLFERGLVSLPLFYVSSYFEARRAEYNERLLAVSRDDDWTGWCRFFLEAVTAQADENPAGRMLALHQRLTERVKEATRSRYALPALDWMFTRPVFNTVHFVAGSTIPARTARRLLDRLVDHGILQEVDSLDGHRGTMLVLGDVLDVAEGRGGG